MSFYSNALQFPCPSMGIKDLRHKVGISFPRHWLGMKFPKNGMGMKFYCILYIILRMGPFCKIKIDDLRRRPQKRSKEIKMT